MITIDKNVPMPARRGDRPIKYPFVGMKIGDSFFASNVTASALTNAAQHYRPKKFIARSQLEDGKTGARCWRMK